VSDARKRTFWSRLAGPTGHGAVEDDPERTENREAVLVVACCANGLWSSTIESDSGHTGAQEKDNRSRMDGWRRLGTTSSDSDAPLFQVHPQAFFEELLPLLSALQSPEALHEPIEGWLPSLVFTELA